MSRSDPIRRVLIAIVMVVLTAAALPVGVAAADPASAPVPRVVIIVGPAGEATERYREEARAAADDARRFTPDVVELYSPNATWPAVRDALQGASLVIYMGHGNGWPSRYRDGPYPPTQNGFGLNPHPGGGDVAHQYFGEARIAAEIKLAKHAVVLLHHLCYASGLSEPGLPEGSLDEARQRVDNFAAGFIAAGADAVIAEAYASPTRYVAAILGGRRSIDAIWRTSPTANGHAFAFDSIRSPGYVAQMDPAGFDAGFERSLVARRGLVPADVLAGASGSPTPRFIADPTLPSLVQTGIQLGTPTLTGSLLAGGTTRLRIPFVIDERGRLPERLEVSARWQPLDPPAGDPVGSADPDAAAVADLVVAEAPGALVDPVALGVGRRQLSATIDVPAAPGRYRLTLTLHDDVGLAFDGISQAMLPTLLVRATGEVDGAVGAPAAVTVSPGDAVPIPIVVANLGVVPWGRAADLVPRGRPRVAGTSASVALHWIPLGPADPDTPVVIEPVDLPDGLAPGAIAAITPTLTSPGAPGDYLLVVDVRIPGHGSLTALGVSPAIVRVTVAAPLSVPAIDDAPEDQPEAARAR